MRTDEETFFAAIDPDDFNENDGNVDSPTGWFGFITLGPETMAEDIRLTNELGIDYVPENGTYFVVICSQGFVEVALMDKADAELQFDQLQGEFANWLNDDEGGN